MGDSQSVHFYFTFLTDWICRRSELRDHGEDLPLLASPKGIKAVIMSSGRGKIIVEFFSALMLLSVCKYLNWNKNKVKQKQSRGIGRCTAYNPLKQNGPWMPFPWRKGIPKGPGIQAKGKWITLYNNRQFVTEPYEDKLATWQSQWNEIVIE